MRLLAADTLHVTLVFLGYLPEKAIPEVMDCLRPGAGPAPVLTPAGLVALPPRRPRLFALELDDEEGRAADLQARMSSALEAARLYRPEKRPWWPHLTLARVKRGRVAVPLADPVPPPGAPCEAGEIVLYRSHLAPAGARYESLVRVPAGN